uniref:Uncharacterized protein n=1 Tax=Romanomermis culicivorax TaxID=13658 RepID=A0A915I1G2_ROMCU
MRKSCGRDVSNPSPGVGPEESWNLSPRNSRREKPNEELKGTAKNQIFNLAVLMKHFFSTNANGTGSKQLKDLLYNLKVQRRSFIILLYV